MSIFNFYKKNNFLSKNPEKLSLIFSNTEKFFIFICILLIFLNLIFSVQKNIQFEWGTYFLIFTFPIFVLLVGQFYRTFRPDESIARPCIYFSLFLIFSSLMTAFNHLLLPGLFPRIDPILQSLDESIGFYWLDVARTFSEWPIFSKFLLEVYQSSVIQIIGLVLMLGYFRKDKSLVSMFLTCVIAAIITIGFWCIFPSSGPSSFILQQILPEQFPFSVNHIYGQRMNDLFTHGMDIISPDQTMGLVSFPSFHTVMALMCVVYSRPLKWVFPVFLVLNIFMIPAVIIHGSHYLVDLIGGVVVFTFAAWLTSKLVKKIDPTLQDHANHKTAPLQ